MLSSLFLFNDIKEILLKLYNDQEEKICVGDGMADDYSTDRIRVRNKIFKTLKMVTLHYLHIYTK